jgi:hypothetical protein
MTGKSLEELIDGEVEGTNTPLESARLRERASRERDVIERLEAHRRAAASLAAAVREEAPPGLSQAVMERVRAEDQPSSASGVLIDRTTAQPYGVGRHLPSGGRRMATSRKVLVGIAAAAVVAIGYFAVNGFPPIGPGAAGTVGAAQRYQSEQMNAADVTVRNDGVQALLQSDDFRHVVSNKETREILTSREFQRAVSDASVQALLHQLASDRSFADSLRLAASDAAAQKLFADAARAAAAVDAVRSGAADAARSGAADAARSSLLSLASHNQAFAQLAKNEAFAQALHNGAFASLLANQGFANLISNPAAAGVFASGAFQQAVASGAVQKAVDAAAGSAASAGAVAR